MSFPLFISMLKMNAKLVMNFAVASVLYMCLVIWIYPTIAGEGINKLMQAMPEELLSIVGMKNGLSSVGDYMAGEYYGLLFPIILSIYCIMTATRLVARLVDRGSMANLLATPNSRVKIAITQSIILISGIFIITFFTTIGGLAGVPLISPDLELEVVPFIKVNVVGFLLFFVVSGYCFLFSCLINDEKQALAWPTGITIVFFFLNMAGKLSSETDWLLNFTLFSVYDPHEIMNGDANFIMVSISLAAIGIILYVVSIVLFKKRDLPL